MPEHKSIDFGAKPILDMGDELQNIYDHLNWRLFENRLPNCIITLKRRTGTSGFFTARSYDRKDGTFSDEIIMNPALYGPENPSVFLAVLVHQMVHLWQVHYGAPGRAGYHNREWADEMIEIGLQSSQSGQRGGRETGDTMYQLIISGGEFEKAAQELMRSGGLLTWRQCDKPAPPKSYKSGKRQKFTCPECGVIALSSHGAELACTQHDLPIPMQPD